MGAAADLCELWQRFNFRNAIKTWTGRGSLPLKFSAEIGQASSRLYLLLTVNTVGCKMRGAMGRRVESERGKKYVGLPEFAMVCERVVSDLALEQERGTVTTVPDERTIRYYISEGLIQAPEEKQGTASVFGYRNLLQLVAIKKLQAEHLPIRKIRELVSGKSEEELEALLGVGEDRRRKHSDAKSYLETLLTSAPLAHFGQPPQSRPSQPASAPEPGAGLKDPAPQGSWHRVEIEPGLELHIRSDYTPPTTSARTRSLADRIRGIIAKWRS